MNFTLSEEQKLLQETARRFARQELPELARELDAKDHPVDERWMARYAEMGFFGINVPEQYGGQGMGHLEAVLVLEELAKISSAVAMPVFEGNFGPMAVLVHFAPEALKRRLLPQVCAGKLLIAVSMSEPDAGTALTDLKTRARLNDNKVVINGTKRWCSGAGHAQGYLVYCRLSDAPGAAGIGAVYVEKGTPGFNFGKREELMGFRGIETADMFFDNVELPADHVVLPAGSFGKLMAAFNLERCGNTTMSLGVASGALDYALGYVQERRQFGKPIVDFQAVQLKLAEMALKVEASRLLLYRAVANAGQGLPTVLESSMAKCFANEIVREVAGAAMQLMGGYGYSKQFDMERRLRDAWGWGIAGGTIDVQKVNIAAALVGRRFDQRR
ncbi:MAG: butyryl-CoA dehydrogenase [Betaproteobacteria bacterium RIFCSPLOWO2_12_FULL_65_14]|nr:MAG: butyryl-CoA dehydrogenase [Betaproteobacteria bacterium RIFCSPLOWO2_12_FULL_65_14]